MWKNSGFTNIVPFMQSGANTSPQNTSQNANAATYINATVYPTSISENKQTAFLMATDMESKLLFFSSKSSTTACIPPYRIKKTGNQMMKEAASISTRCSRKYIRIFFTRK